MESINPSLCLLVIASSRLKTHLMMLWHMETKNRWFEHHCLYYKRRMYITKPSEPHNIKKGIKRWFKRLWMISFYVLFYINNRREKERESVSAFYDNSFLKKTVCSVAWRPRFQRLQVSPCYNDYISKSNLSLDSKWGNKPQDIDNAVYILFFIFLIQRVNILWLLK
jgi:hypothetical protein